MGRKILIVDDEEHVVKVLKSRLEVNDYEVVVAYDGEEGMGKVKTEKPDLILLDIIMPKMDGYTFMEKIKQDTSLSNIPIIVLTAKAQMKDLFEVEGVTDYVVKPYEPEDLLNRIRKYLK